MDVAVVGIDCATDDANVGAAFGAWRGGGVAVHDVMACGTTTPVQAVATWLRGVQEPILIALDAPLGWPVALTQALCQHRAGDELVVEADRMFRHGTDRFIHKTVGKRPLDVGADRIARTAHAALRLLGELRRTLASPVPLAWSPQNLPLLSAIEVYPAATLAAHGIRSTGYKRAENLAERKEIISPVSCRLNLPADVTLLEGNANVLDAVVCLLAARDFLQDRCPPPSDQRLAEQEGWIWSARRSGRGEG